MSESFDLTILGGGPGGYVAALRAAQLGLRTALVDEGGIGGTCLQRGCIPTKALLASAAAYECARDGEAMGVLAENVRFDLSRAVARKDAVVAELVGGIEKLLEKRGVTVIRGRGRLDGPRAVVVTTAEGERRVEAPRLILATGSRPAAIPCMPVDGEVVMTSDEALAMTEKPASLLIVGAGVIGCEFATFFARVGVAVTLVEALDRILPGADKALAKQVQVGLKKQGVTVRTKVRITSLTSEKGRAVAVLEGGERLEAERALVAVGRRPNVEGLGLEEAGIRIDRGVVVDEATLATSVEGVWALGDVTGRWWLAHVASAQGVVAAERAAGHDARFDGTVVPACTFTHPELAQVGLTEDACKEAGLAYRTGRFQMAANGKALAGGEGQGTVKLLVAADDDRILGCHILGPHASDLIAEVAVAMRNAVGAEGLGRTIHAHPTLAEVVHEAAEAALGRPLHQM